MLLRRHVHHARARIRKEAKLLAATASRCINHLQVAEVMDGKLLRLCSVVLPGLVLTVLINR